MTTEPIYIDNSMLTTLAVCDQKALMRYAFGLTSLEERSYFLAGTAGHEANAHYFKSHGDKVLALDTAETLYKEWADANLPSDDAKSWVNVKACLANWYDNHPITSLPFVPLPNMVEIGFSFPLTDDGMFNFVGRIDLVAREVEGDGLWIVDHKFPGRLDASFPYSYRMDSQMSGYVWAAQQQLEQPIRGAFINACELTRVPSSDRKCREHGVAYAECGPLHLKSVILTVPRSPAQLSSWKRNAIALAKRYAALRADYPVLATAPLALQQGQFVYKGCSSCDFADWCAAGRPMSNVASMYRHEPWEPWKDARGLK
jgi:hypothetical protein